MQNGRITGKVARADATEERVMSMAMAKMNLFV
jgi:ABC-type sugar transport system ATPase subunit